MDWLTRSLIDAVRLCRRIEQALLRCIASRQRPMVPTVKPAPSASGQVVARGNLDPMLAKAFGIKTEARVEKAGQRNFIRRR